MKTIQRIIRTLFDPSYLMRRIWARVPIGSFEFRLQFDAMKGTHFAYGMFRAAQLAQKLGIKKISCIEMGFWQGNGLREMEKLAGQVEEATGVELELYGFDTGTGMPPSNDYRDMLFNWDTNEFAVDLDTVRRSLKRTKLIIGDVKNTAGAFSGHAPIGFISFDLDYYSSTMNAFKIFNAPHLPRIFCYFDDVMGDMQLYNEFMGQLLAIKDFNERSKDMKLAKINGFPFVRFLRSPWPEQFYVLHDLTHPLYAKFINGATVQPTAFRHIKGRDDL